MNRIDARSRTVRELLASQKYSIDFYQREYAWEERQMRELIDDLTGKFLDAYEPTHSRRDIDKYGNYFLGSIVISNKDGRRFIVDGQQRLTSLTLLLIFLHHRQKHFDDRTEIKDLIFSMRRGDKTFNLDVPDRVIAMEHLFEQTAFIPDTNHNESTTNILRRYADIATHWPEELEGRALVYFVDWLIENVHLVEIEAFSDEDAYTIFETMNDRGLSLSLAEMLKGYVLANITTEINQRKANDIWKKNMLALKDLGAEEDIDFFKNWLRSQHAETIRPGSKGAENKDYERIGTEFHRWIRDARDRLQLGGTDDFLRLIERDLAFYAQQTLTIRKAALSLTPGLESIRFNEDRKFTLQTQLILAALSPDDPPETTKRKMSLVADFIDIWLARRSWCFRTTSYSSVRYTVFQLTKDLRRKSLEQLSLYLKDYLDNQEETFARQPRYRLNGANQRNVRHTLARLTHWVDLKCGLSTHFEDLISEGKARPFEIEHIWPNKYERFADAFPHQGDFDDARNMIGGLCLLQRGFNQSIGDAAFEEKRDAYLAHSQNLLARSLHPKAYENNPAFKKFMEETHLEFRAYEKFHLAEQAERQELYIRICEWVWNPSRLDLDGEKPPVPEPVSEIEEEPDTSEDGPTRHAARLDFWTALLMHAKDRSSLHENISPRRYGWIGTRKHGQWWNYVVTQNQTRVELYMDADDKAANKALFDALSKNKQAIEHDFKDQLSWQRLDDRRASRICFTVNGGWADQQSWPGAIENSVDAMERLYKACAPHVQKFRGK